MAQVGGDMATEDEQGGGRRRGGWAGPTRPLPWTGHSSFFRFILFGLIPLGFLLTSFTILYIMI